MHVNELVHLPVCLRLLLLLTTYPRSNARFNTRSPRGRLKLEPGEFGDTNLSCPRVTSDVQLPPRDLLSLGSLIKQDERFARCVSSSRVL